MRNFEFPHLGTLTVLVSLSLSAAACGIFEPQTRAARVTLLTSRPLIRMGDSAQFSLVSRSDGSPIGGSATQWTSSDTTVLRIDAQGASVAQGTGRAVVRATSGSSSADTTLEIGPALMSGAGDIAYCTDLTNARKTAAMLDTIPGLVFTLGDNVYDTGTAAEWQNCYEPTWGRHKARTFPSIGNHDWYADSARSYAAYWAPRFGLPGFYSYDVGSWHVVVLNFEIDHSQNSVQTRWLHNDLAEHHANCLLAYWHEPAFSSWYQTSSTALLPFWNELYAAEADLILNGHAHVYERFAPQTPTGIADASLGIREIVAGTGGAEELQFVTVAPNSEVRVQGTSGLLRLWLSSHSYRWQYVTTEGVVADSGSAACHR